MISNKDSSSSSRQTSQERQTAKLQETFLRHLRTEYTGIREEHITRKNLYYLSADEPLEVWFWEGDRDNKKTTIWLMWDGKEMFPDDDLCDLVKDILSSERERRQDDKLRYWSSPEIVSAALALIFGITIALVLLLNKTNPPNEMWTILAAVVAFYFGRENLALGRRRESVPERGRRSSNSE